ncbi:rhodanese-like domain-containing protein [Mycolicibacterium setense]
MFKRMCSGGAAIVAAVALASCGASTDRPSPGSIESGAANIAHHRLADADEFATTIGEFDTLTVNVHVPYQGDIPGTDLSIPFDRVAEQSDRLPSDRGATIAIYCRTGPMSATAAETLKSLGYTDVVELDGGMKAWQASGRSLVGN